jgi:polysaccharide pyruvyl transferase WcaK-like protein
MRREMTKVVIPEPIPSLNKGEKAILEGIRVAVSVLNDVSLSLYSPWYEDDRKRYSSDVRLVKGTDFFNVLNMYSDAPKPFNKISYIKRWGKLVCFASIARISKTLANLLFKDELLCELSKANLILVGHDGNLCCELFWFVLAGNIMHIPVAIYGVGGETGGQKTFSGWNKKILQYAFNHTILNVVRDCGTKQFLIDHGIPENKLHLYPDTAVLMKPCSDQRAIEILKTERIPIEKHIPLFGLIPVRGGVVFNKSFSNAPDKKAKYLIRINFWSELVNYLLDKTNAFFVFLPHCIGPVSHNDDRIIAREIMQRIDKNRDRIALIETEYRAQELKGVIKHCDFVLSERAHALIGAVSVATPCMALAVEEDQRMHNIIDTMFGRKVYNLNNPDVDDLKKVIVDEWDNREKIKPAMAVLARKILNEADEAAQLLKQRFYAYGK